MSTTKKRTHDVISVSSTTFTGDEVALTFFSKPEFTGDKKRDIDYLSELMEEKGFNAKTVREVFDQAGSRKAAVTTLKFLPVEHTEIEKYYDMLQSIEDRLAAIGIIAVDGDDEINVINKRYTPLTTTKKLADQDLPGSKTDHRTPEICMVLGSSGSGKSFFAVKDLPASIRLDVDMKGATIYLLPGTLVEDYDSAIDSNGNDFHTFLLQYIKEKIKDKFKIEIVARLEMHLTVVMDEAGAGTLEGYFEKKNNLVSLYNHLKTNLATSVWLVVCGTGLHGNQLSSREDVRKFRMGLWTDNEAEELLKWYKKFSQDEISGLIHALSSQATLQALLTNARSAFFLLNSIESAYNQQLKWRDSIKWVDRLSELTPSLVASVVAEYIDNNGLKGVARNDLFRIAASVFRAVEKGRNEAVPTAPTFDHLPIKNQYTAMALIDLNVEVSGKTVTYVRTEVTSSVLVSPAIVVVLFSLLGVQAGVLSGWHAQELITALVVFRERVRSMYEACLEHGNLVAFQRRYTIENDVSIDQLGTLRKDRDGYERGKEMILIPTAPELHEKLEIFRSKLDMVRLLKPVPEGSSSKNIYIPIVDNEVTCINGDKAPFADVFTAFALYQCKHTAAKAKTLVFSTPNELWKCGLLREQDKDSRGRIVLRGLYALWTGALGHVGKKKASSQQTDTTTELPSKVKSKAYPVNMLNCPLRRESTPYAKLSKVGGVWMMENGSPLPELPKDFQLSFVISTNAASIVLDTDIAGFLKKKLAMPEAEEEEMFIEERVEEKTPFKKLAEDKTLSSEAIAIPKAVTVSSKTTPKLPVEFLERVLHGVDINFLFT